MIATTAHRRIQRGPREAIAGALFLISQLLRVAAASEATTAQLTRDPTDYFAPNSLHRHFNGRLTFNQYLAYSMHSLAQVAGFDTDLHRYDDKQNLVDSFERNGTRASLADGEPLSSFLAGARFDSSEFELLHDQPDATLIENELNQAKCAQQLDFIYKQALDLFKNYGTFANSKRLDLIDFLDSYGAAPGAQLTMGNNQWLGSYHQCRRAQVDMAANLEDRPQGDDEDEQRIGGRYCLAKLRLPKLEGVAGEISITLGVCLPQTCNSISYLRHSERLEALIKLARLQQVPYSSARLVQLYCLPDENSPLRQLSPSARAFLTLASCWLALVIFASARYAWTRDSESKLVQIFAFQYAWQKLFDLEVSSASNHQPAGAPVAAAKHETVAVANTDGLLARRLALEAADTMRRQNLEQYFASGAPKAVAANGGAQREGRQQRLELPKSIVMKIHSRDTSCSSTTLETPAERAAGEGQIELSNRPAPAAKISDRQQLNAVDGIKVISMIWLISAHTMLFFIRTISNGRDFWSLLLDFRFLTVMAGIFPVDSFFTVTGVLTSYLKFNQTPGAETKQQLKRPSYWLEIFVRRYMRFMPMYLLIFWYTRDVSEYIGQGPMWDYATASTSLRAQCKRESVLVPMLFQANFKPLEQHCVKPAWYLANDYQFLLITPLFMLLLLLSRRLGYLVIGASVAGSVVLQFLTVYYPDAGANFADFAGLVNFRPMFATYVLKDLWRLYVLPYNRIPPYLIGLLTGHLMYKFNKRRQRQRAAASAAQAQPTCSSPTPSTGSTDSIEFSSAASSSSGVSSGQEAICEAAPRCRKAPNWNQEAPAATRDDEQPQRRRSLVNLGLWGPLVALIAIIYLPLATKLLEPLAGESARIGASLIIALMRLVWSLAMGRLIYVCFTAAPPGPEQAQQRARSSPVIKLLSAGLWRPWSKIGLSVLLVQWEVISYIAQTQTSLPLMSISFLLAMVFFCIIGSYVLGLLVYLIFEFPLSQVELLCIRPKLFA